MIQDFSQLVLKLPRDLFILSIVRILETYIGSKDNGQSSYVQYKIDRYLPCQTDVGLLVLSIISDFGESQAHSKLCHGSGGSLR